MAFCYVWPRQLFVKEAQGFERQTTRSPDELIVYASRLRGIEHLTEGLASVDSRMARALKPGAPLAFTYHHNRLETYSAVGVAILDAGLICTASLPCPAEMVGSIHIHGTTSSIVDTVFVCRSDGTAPHGWHFDTPDQLAEIVTVDLKQLGDAMKPITAQKKRIRASLPLT